MGYWYTFGIVNPKKPRPPCLYCGKEPYRSFYKYCSNACQAAYQYKIYIGRWKEGKESGLQSIGIVNSYIKRYLRNKYQNKCCLCGWSKTHPKTGLVPLVADHIDGNWRNNVESNLRLLCPNCDSLTPTFAALNKENGRKHRAASNRAKEGREFMANLRKQTKVHILSFAV